MINQITIFSRIAGIAVNKALAPQNRNQDHDRAQMLVNNMNLINDTLVRIAIKMVRRNNSINKDELMSNLKEIIELSVVSYAKRAY